MITGAKVKQNYHIANIVYGPLYTRFFLENHLRSILDPSNLPEVFKDYNITYVIFTDEETRPQLEQHPRFIELSKYALIEMKIIKWVDEQHFERRYEIIVKGFGFAIKRALEEGALFTPLVADYVVAKGFFSCLLKRIKEGHDAVLLIPPRCAAETAAQLLPPEGALEARDLFQICFDNLHSVWRNSYWSTPRFTIIPFVLLWGSERGLLVRTFSLSPLIFKPNERMLLAEGVIDREIPALCENPFFATDWIDAPVVNMEPALCYLGWFGSVPSSAQTVGQWSKTSLHKTQHKWLKRSFYYPSEAECGVPTEALAESSRVIEEIERWSE